MNTAHCIKVYTLSFVPRVVILDRFQLALLIRCVL